MIYTITFNPALDYLIHSKGLIYGNVNRSEYEDIYYGGKGINVSCILKELNVDSVALGFIAGFTGDELERGVRAKGIKTDFIRLKKGITRINVKIKSAAETELNCVGPDIDEEAVNALIGQIENMTEDDMIVLAGSIPKSLSDMTYAKILEKAVEKKVRTAVDAEGKLLLNALEYHPFIVKPNSIELGSMFGRDLKNVSEIVEYAKKLKGMGSENVLVSMAGDGAVLIDENNKVHTIQANKGTVKNSVGAGDSMLAGFIAGYIEKGDYDYALKLGNAAGGATAFSDDLAKREDILKLM